MGNSAPAELAPNNESDLKKKWISDIKEVKQSDWCKAALKMIGKDATMPNLEVMMTVPPMREARKHGLTAAEASALFLYSSALYRPINSALRKGKLSSDSRHALETMIANVDSGLKKLPEVKEPLARVVKLKKGFGEKLQVGKEWRERGYGSCVRADKRHMQWDGNYELHFQVARGAHDISAFSDAPKEGEVLIERDQAYSIDKRTLDGKDSVKHVSRDNQSQAKRVMLALSEKAQTKRT